MGHGGACTALSVHIAESLAASIITTVEAVSHTEMRFTATMTRSAILTSMIPASAAIHSPAMSATINGIEMWATEEEIVSARISGVDSEMKISGVPIERTIEIACCAEITVLPIQ